DGIDLSVPAGEIFGLLGPNGAGKTTTISICTTRALPSGGAVSIAGIDVVRHPSRARVHLGVVPQYNTLDRALTIFENLYYHCRYFGFPRQRAGERSRELLAQFQLLERESAYPSELSGGLQQRIQIARAIAHRPSVLFLDEPSAGLDPQSRIAMWDAVRALRSEGITIVLTTHYMEEADVLCDRVAIVDKGRILALDTPQQLKKTLGTGTLLELRLRDLDRAPELLPLLVALDQVDKAERTPQGVRLFARHTEGLLARVVPAAEPFGLRDLSIQEPSLETVFIRLTGRELRD
ncbi:MAG TPA: ATP-binding cassette domain-containing protein, partial [Acidobacteriaceae bacterium]